MSTAIQLEPIGVVRGGRSTLEDDHWGGAVAAIELVPALPIEALRGLDAFSHVEVLFHFHRLDPAKIVTGARRPRDNPAWPEVGIFAQRGRNRPNRLGLTCARVVRVEGRTLYVAELDAVDGTPVLDLKPVMVEMLPRTPVHQPPWASELMRAYWSEPE